MSYDDERFDLNGLSAKRDVWVDLKLPGATEWYMVSADHTPSRWGFSGTWKYHVLGTYTSDKQPVSIPPVGAIPRNAAVRWPEWKAFCAGANFAFDGLEGLDRACMVLLSANRAPGPELVRAWSGRPGPGEALQLPRGTLTPEDNTRLDIALALWRSYGGKPKAGLVDACDLVLIPVAALPEAAALIRSLRSSLASSPKLDAGHWAGLQAGIGGGDRELALQLIRSSTNAAFQRVAGLSDAGAHLIAGLIDAMAEGPARTTKWCRKHT